MSIICAALLILSFAAIASAEVQNVKVSGDLSIYSLWRQHYDLDKDGGTYTDDAENGFFTVTALQVNADLTDNVSAVVRVANQRFWDSGETGSYDTTQYDLDIDLAYIQIKEMFYSPLTVTIGRQDLWFGKGFIVGTKMIDPELGLAEGSDWAGTEYTEFTAFDAIRATLDYDPWTIDLVYSKIYEEDITDTDPVNDDTDLYGVNVGYQFDSYNGEAEAYFWWKHDRQGLDTMRDKINTIGTVGGRGSFDPVENATIGLEGAFQFGDYFSTAAYTADSSYNHTRSRRAWAADASAEYRWPTWTWKPKVGIEYIYYSGEKNLEAGSTDEWNGWDPIYRGKFDTAIREFQNLFYTTAVMSSALIQNQNSGFSNQHQIIVFGQIKPAEDLTLDARWAYFLLAEEYNTGVEATTAGSDEVGCELDLQLTYDYTEDLSFGLLTAWFWPGDLYASGHDDVAADVVASAKLSF